MGGDEFVVLLDDVDEDIARRRGRGVLRRLRRELWDTVSPDVRVSVSVGIAAGEGPSDELLERADRALYAAKSSGRAAVAVAPQDGDCLIDSY